MTEPDPPGGDGLLEEAASWFARMRGPNPESSRAGFEAWLARGAVHRSAYNRAAEIFAMGKLLADETPEGQAPPSHSRHRRRRLAAVAASLAAAAAGSWAVHQGFAPAARVADASVGATVGVPLQAAGILILSGPRTERLADGSLVRLGEDASLSVEMTRAARALTLEQGRARFFVAHEPRPFLVFAAGGYVAARGTVFDVAVSADRQVTVRLVQGVIDVSPPITAGRTSQPRRLAAGQSMSFSGLPEIHEPGLALSSKAQDDDRKDGFAANSRDFDSISLADLVRIANRGADRPIRIADPVTGRMRVSGTFRTNDPDLLAERLAGLLGLAADRRDNGDIVLGPK